MFLGCLDLQIALQSTLAQAKVKVKLCIMHYVHFNILFLSLFIHSFIHCSYLSLYMYIHLNICIHTNQTSLCATRGTTRPNSVSIDNTHTHLLLDSSNKASIVDTIVRGGEGGCCLQRPRPARKIAVTRAVASSRLTLQMTTILTMVASSLCSHCTLA